MAQPILLAHWCNLIPNFEFQPSEFYAIVDRALEGRKIPNFRSSRIQLSEGGVFSAKREYLRCTRESLLFDICGAPYGNGFFVSSRLGEMPDGCLMIPILGPIYRFLFKPETYYRLDGMMMYQKAVHGAVIEAVDEITKQKGIAPLSELERKPIFTDIFKS